MTLTQTSSYSWQSMRLGCVNLKNCGNSSHVCILFNTMNKNIDLNTFLERLGFSPFFPIESNKITLYNYFIGINFMETKELN